MEVTGDELGTVVRVDNSLRATGPVGSMGPSGFQQFRLLKEHLACKRFGVDAEVKQVAKFPSLFCNLLHFQIGCLLNVKVSDKHSDGSLYR